MTWRVSDLEVRVVCDHAEGCDAFVACAITLGCDASSAGCYASEHALRLGWDVHDTDEGQDRCVAHGGSGRVPSCEGPRPGRPDVAAHCPAPEGRMP